MYKFINWRSFFEQIKQVRILNLQGSMGTGKTLLSVALGYHFLKEGYVKSCCYNFPVSFGVSPSPRWSFSAVDEAGTIFDARMAFKNKELNQKSAALTWRLRKLGSYLVIPSFLDVDKRFRAGVRMWRRMAVGNLFWVFHWELGEEEADLKKEGINFWQGWLGFWNPKHFFGTYDTYFFPGENLTRAFLDGLLLSVEQTQRVPDRVRRSGIPGV